MESLYFETSTQKMNLIASMFSTRRQMRFMLAFLRTTKKKRDVTEQVCSLFQSVCESHCFLQPQVRCRSLPESSDQFDLMYYLILLHYSCTIAYVLCSFDSVR